MGTLHEVQYMFLIVYRPVLLRIKTFFFQTKVVEKIVTHIFMFNNFFPRKSCHLLDNVEKYDRARQATIDNMAHAHCMPDNSGYKHALRICNTYSTLPLLLDRKIICMYVCMYVCICIYEYIYACMLVCMYMYVCMYVCVCVCVCVYVCLYVYVCVCVCVCVYVCMYVCVHQLAAVWLCRNWLICKPLANICQPSRLIIIVENKLIASVAILNLCFLLWVCCHVCCVPGEFTNFVLGSTLYQHFHPLSNRLTEIDLTKRCCLQRCFKLFLYLVPSDQQFYTNFSWLRARPISSFVSNRTTPLVGVKRAGKWVRGFPVCSE